MAKKLPDFITKFDGTDRKPREVQEKALRWLSENWHNHNIFCLSLPVGSGKSAIARAIQITTDASIITPSNILIDQYVDTYKDVNYLKGQAKYTCPSAGVSCEIVKEALEGFCENCTYQCCRDKAVDGAPTFYNPMSLFYARKDKEFKASSGVMVVDEAHQVQSMLYGITGKRFRKSEYKFKPSAVNEIYCIQWMKDKLNNLERMYEQYKSNANERARITGEYRHIETVLSGLVEDPANYTIWIEDGTFRGKPEKYLNIQPLTIPKHVLRNVLGKVDKLILMSGTLFEHDVRELTSGQPYGWLDLPSPIPKERRAIHYNPINGPTNYTTPVEVYVEAIMGVLKNHPGENTIIHVPYSLAAKLKPVFPVPIITHDQDDKEEKLKEFTAKGGIFLASGCAEGLDLKGDLCRVNIIPKLLYPDMSSKIVEKKKDKFGQSWLDQQTLKTTIQQCGRSTRTETDWSRTYILDSSFSRLINRNVKTVPRSFIESLVWSK